MAQHIPLEKIPLKKCRERAKRLKGSKLTKYGSLLWEEVEPNRFIYLKGIRMPESYVCGGRAELEAITDDKDIIKEIYLVA